MNDKTQILKELQVAFKAAIDRVDKMQNDEGTIPGHEARAILWWLESAVLESITAETR